MSPVAHVWAVPAFGLQRTTTRRLTHSNDYVANLRRSLCFVRQLEWLVALVSQERTRRTLLKGPFGAAQRGTGAARICSWEGAGRGQKRLL
jgi:hypothetical protein